MARIYHYDMAQDGEKISGEKGARVTAGDYAERESAGER